jgi:hypothetical protein
LIRQVGDDGVLDIFIAQQRKLERVQEAISVTSTRSFSRNRAA